MSILAICFNKRQETVSLPKYSLKSTKVNHYFWNSVYAKTKTSVFKFSKTRESSLTASLRISRIYAEGTPHLKFTVVVHCHCQDQ